MKSMIVNVMLKLVSVDMIASVIAKAIAKLLKHASERGGDTWDKAKKVVQKVKVWIDLFLEVYDDDDLTADEEQKIANAIKNETNLEKLVDIIKSNEKKDDSSDEAK